MKSDILIIGGGQAGCMVAVALRQKKFTGSVLIIGEENHRPYQRPPLSKGFLNGEIELEKIYLKSNDYYKNNKISLITGKSVIMIDKENKNIELDNHEKFTYDKLVITTGSKLRKLNFDCNEKNIFYLRTIEDAINIQTVLNNKKHIIIIGAGYIGLEIAASAISKNINVTVLEMENRVMKRSVCSITSDFLEEKHTKYGVNFIFNISITEIKDHLGHKRIIFSDGNYIDSDAVVVGVGIEPNTELALKAGLECNNGILVDDNGQTSHKNIFSAGDCANHPNRIFQRRIRLESVHNAVEQAKTVAAAIKGENKPYNQVPWFWSNQYDVKLQIAGISSNYDECIVEGSLKEEKFTVFYFMKEKLVAVDTINNNKAFTKGRKLISSGARHQNFLEKNTI